MTTGSINVGLAPEYEDHTSLKKYIRHENSKWSKMNLIRSIINQAGTGSVVDLSEKGGLTIGQKASTALSIFLAADTDSGDYDGESVTGYYITNAGVKSSFTILFNTTNTTEVAGPTDFYCWNLEDYTAATVLVSSVAASTGENIYIGTTGMVANAELRLATIAAAATYPVVTTLFGSGDVYGKEETNTAGDVGKVCTLDYLTPWGSVKQAKHTLAADTTTIVRLLDATTGLPTVDYFRTRHYSTTAVTGKYVGLGFDADKRAGTVALDTWYGVIEEGYHKSIHSRYMVPKDRDVWMAHMCITQSIGTNLDCYMNITLTPYGETVATTCKVPIPNNAVFTTDPMFRLAALSEISFTITGNLSDNSIDITFVEAVQH